MAFDDDGFTRPRDGMGARSARPATIAAALAFGMALASAAGAQTQPAAQPAARPAPRTAARPAVAATRPASAAQASMTPRPAAAPPSTPPQTANALAAPAKPATKPAEAKTAANSNYTDIPFSSDDPEAPVNDRGRSRARPAAWAKYWIDTGSDVPTSTSTRTMVVLGGIAY